MLLNGTLGSLGSSSADIYNQVTSQGGSTSQAEAAARSGSITTYTSTVDQASTAMQSIWSSTQPSIKLSAVGVKPYDKLSDKKYAFTDMPWPTPILNPHTTTALNWVTRGVPVVNKGSPRSIYDPVEYLRSALIDSDWDRVYYWFAVQYNDIYKRVGNQKDAFFPFANINILDYKYVVTDSGQRIYYPFSLWDIKQFLTRIVLTFTIADYQHSSGHCTIGLINWYAKPPYPYTNTAMFTAYTFENALDVGLWSPWQKSSSVFQYESPEQLVASARNPVSKSSACGDFRVGWIQGPKGDWTATQIVTTIVILVATLGAGWYAAPAATAGSGAGAAASVGEATATTATTVSSTAAVAGSAASLAADLPTIVVTGVAPVAAGSVAGAIAAGSIGVIATAPAVIGAPSISVPSTPSTPPPAPTTDLQTVVITGTKAATTGAGSAINAAVAAGAVVATSIPPPVVNTPSAPPSTETLQEVTVTGKAPTPVPGAVTVAPAVLSTLPVSTPSSVASSSPGTSDTSQSNTSNNDPDSPKSGQSLQDWLQQMIKKYGLKWVEAHLAQLLAKYFPHGGPAQTAAAQQQLDATPAQSTDTTPWILGGAALLVLIAATRSH